MKNEKMKQRTILFLGGSPDQSTSYIAAKEMGLYIIGVDGNPDAFAFQYADESHSISVRDYENILDMLDGRPVHAVYSQASDAGRMCEYQLAKALGTPKPISMKSVNASMDKGYFLDSLAAAGLPHHGHIKCSGVAQMQQAVADWPFPFVVKPNDSSGSKGVLLVRDIKERDAAILAAVEISPTDTLICEQLVKGRHYSVDTFIRNHKVEFMAVSQKTMTAMPLMIPKHYIMPAPIPSELQAHMKSYVEQICTHLDISAGPITCDVVLGDDEKLYFIEMGARAGGNGLSLLLDKAFGVDYVPSAVALHLGETRPVTPKYQRNSALITITAPVCGTLKSISGLKQLYDDGLISEYRTFFKPGEDVAPYTKAANALGYVLLEEQTPEQLKEKIAHIGQTVSVEVETSEGLSSALIDVPQYEPQYVGSDDP